MVPVAPDARHNNYLLASGLEQNQSQLASFLEQKQLQLASGLKQTLIFTIVNQSHIQLYSKEISIARFTLL